MKRLFTILISSCLLLTFCQREESNFILCGKQKGLFSFHGFHPVSLDTITNLETFYNKTKPLLDSSNQCSLDFAIVYNYNDSSFIRNPDSNRNILLPGIHVISDHCQEDRAVASLVIYLDKDDSILVQNRLLNNSEIINRDFNKLDKIVNDFYHYIYLNGKVKKHTYIRVVISSKDPFTGDFLKVWKILFKAYVQSIVKNFKTTKFDLCENDQKLISFRDYQFRVLIDDFDYRKVHIQFKSLNSN